MVAGDRPRQCGPASKQCRADSVYDRGRRSANIHSIGGHIRVSRVSLVTLTRKCAVPTSKTVYIFSVLLVDVVSSNVSRESREMGAGARKYSLSVVQRRPNKY